MVLKTKNLATMVVELVELVDLVNQKLLLTHVLLKVNMLSSSKNQVIGQNLLIVIFGKMAVVKL